MAAGWLTRGRRTAQSIDMAKAGEVALRPRALTALDDLWRHAEWERLSRDERAALQDPYQGITALDPLPPAGRGERADDPNVQAWLADLVARQLQPAAVSVVRTWLEDAPPNTHLYAVGSVGRGRTSVVTALARRAMALQPAPPDYCYAPDPAGLSRSLLLALPAGAGPAFAEALSNALRAILTNWEKPRAHQRTESAADEDEEAVRRQLVTQHIGGVAESAPQECRTYLDRLRATLHDASASPLTPQVAEVDAPAGRVSESGQNTGSAPAQTGAEDEPAAPVIVGSLARMDLLRTLLRANGGVLILPATDFVDRDQPASDWAALRAVLRSGVLAVRGSSEPSIPLALRIALFGTHAPYRTLERVEEFGRFFRYKARFEDETDWVRAAEAAYATLADGVAQRYGLPPFAADAVARIVEEGARRAPRHQRSHLTTDVLSLRDLAVEAGRHALTATIGPTDGAAQRAETAPTTKATTTTASDVEAAIARRRLEQGVAAREAREAILTDRDIVPTAGTAIGAITGLGVVLPHPFESHYAIPFRISATVSPGRERLVDIEREADAADPSHISGALTMAGYLAWRYGRERPISVVARMRFEQEHDYASGPSASAAELFAVLSALAQVPIRCAVAVTGAVGQHGELQVIGAANEKIEGFWEVCRRRRAAGESPEGAYGVLMPAANAGDLMLRPEVAASVASEGWFHVWPIQHVDEGLSLLTSVAAAEIHARVDRQLQRFYDLAVQAGGVR
jgi:predicted ATP-dependent protease